MRIGRRLFLHAAFGATSLAVLLSTVRRVLADAEGQKGTSSMSEQSGAQAARRMPVLFVGHGSPMNAIEDNTWSRGFHTLASLLPPPRAILSVSAHWYIPGSFLTGNDHPETIHDFGGFPPELYAMKYPAPGDIRLAERVSHLVGDRRARVRDDWGLDHGTWTVLHHLRPEADLPVVQLSIDDGLPPSGHLAIGRALAPLRDEGVLIMGSGNMTHNLRFAFTQSSHGDTSTPDWAGRFDREAADAIERHDGDHLARMVESADGKLAHPTLDHYLPLLYAVGAVEAGEPVRFPITGFDLGSLSMRAAILG